MGAAAMAALAGIMMVLSQMPADKLCPTNALLEQLTEQCKDVIEGIPSAEGETQPQPVTSKPQKAKNKSNGKSNKIAHSPNPAAGGLDLDTKDLDFSQRTYNEIQNDLKKINTQQTVQEKNYIQQARVQLKSMHEWACNKDVPQRGLETCLKKLAYRAEKAQVMWCAKTQASPCPSLNLTQ